MRVTNSIARSARFVRVGFALAWLASVSPSVFADQPSQYAPGKQVETYVRIADQTEVGCLLYLPRNYEPENAYPMLLFLHGAGESYGLLNKVTKWGPPRMAARGEHFDFILVSPQCQMFQSWNSDRQEKRLIGLLDHMIEHYGADQKRIYVSGFSMGGTGAWYLAARHPDRFAAAIPVCGDADPADAVKLVEMPIWVFHGDRDEVIEIERSSRMIEAIEKAGGTKARLTTLEGIGHNVWSATYATPDVYAWMLKQRRPD